jgi:hypothetical protein
VNHDTKLSDFTAMGWELILTTAVVLFGGSVLLARWLESWLPPGARYGTLVLAIPGVIDMAAFWAVCRARGVRPVKEQAGR